MIAPAAIFTTGDDLDPVLRRIVGRKVRSLVRSRSVARQDAEDFEHDLYVRLLDSAAAFDPGRSHPFAFATMVVDRAASKLMRDCKAQKRDPARAQRLTTDVAVEHRDFEQTEVAIDVAAVIAALSTGQRLLAEHLKTVGVSQTAREVHVSRKAVYRQVSQLRDRFQAAGMEVAHG